MRASASGDVRPGAEHQVPVDSSRNLQRGDEQALQEGATPGLRPSAAHALRVCPPQSMRDHPGREVLEGAFREVLGGACTEVPPSARREMLAGATPVMQRRAKGYLPRQNCEIGEESVRARDEEDGSPYLVINE